ncbi:MAG: hypothetical protein QXL46_04175 [Nitrososphaerales archaeon]
MAKSFLGPTHGLNITDPTRIVVTVSPTSTAARNASPVSGEVDATDNTKIRIRFASAPAAGTNNVSIRWRAEVGWTWGVG